MVHKYSCSSTKKIWGSKYKATVHTILTKNLQFTAHEKYTLVIQWQCVSSFLTASEIFGKMLRENKSLAIVLVQRLL